MGLEQVWAKIGSPCLVVVSLAAVFLLVEREEWATRCAARAHSDVCCFSD